MAEKQTDVIEFEFRGMKFLADANVIRNYAAIKRMSLVETDPVGYFTTLSDIFMGRDEEYVDMLGGEVADMGGLYTAAVQAVGAKNS
ncbi:MAG: hypothetical protein RR842_08135, partial [Gordonibacter sp.]|uniref:hypothetical protein n=1 Tax=Gordonibacter sp. TaxID=1968902 RepID=UPI002FC63199